MNIQKIEVEKLSLAKYNPRKDLKPGDAEFEKLKRSIEEFGYIEPVIWNSRTGNIVGGHQRYKVLKSLGYTEVDCVIVDLDDKAEKALNIALNKIGGEWDMPLLTDLLREIDTSDFDVGLTGFDISELDTMFGKDKKEAQEDNFDIDKAANEPPFVKPRDLWALGRHRLLCGDATKTEDVQRLMDGKKANLFLTDPPYGVSYEGKSKRRERILNDDLRDKALYKFLFDAFTAAEAVLDSEASAYIFHADAQGEYFRKAFREAGFKLSGVCQWVKPSLVLGRSPYQWRHESILFGWKTKGKHLWYTGRAETTIWNYDRPQRNDSHPTMKPIQLLAYPIKNSAAPNAIALDSFCGSGSTLIACEQTGRICYCLELDTKYAGVIVKRYIETAGSADNVTVERDGRTMTFTEATKQVTEGDGNG